jgi:TFIIF-interacting CTD phosphatase-like protein
MCDKETTGSCTWLPACDVGLKDTTASASSIFDATETDWRKKEIRSGEKKKTLVLDLDETLIRAVTENDANAELDKAEDCVSPSAISFGDQGGVGIEIEFYVRPFARDFLQRMSEHYEIIVRRRQD